jgi:hypothetical protein
MIQYETTRVQAEREGRCSTGRVEHHDRAQQVDRED